MLTQVPEFITRNSTLPSRSILVVEDDPFMQKNFQHVIRSIDPSISIECVKTAEEAKTILGKGGPYLYDLVVVDQILGGNKTGLDLWKECKDNFPPMSFILTSGRKWKTIFTEKINEHTKLPPFLPKPFKLEECRNMMATMLDLSTFETRTPATVVKKKTVEEDILDLSWPTFTIFYTFLVWSILVVSARVEESFIQPQEMMAPNSEAIVTQPQESPKIKKRLLPDNVPTLIDETHSYDSAQVLSELSVATSKINTRAKQILMEASIGKAGIEVDQN